MLAATNIIFALHAMGLVASPSIYLSSRAKEVAKSGYAAVKTCWSYHVMNLALLTSDTEWLTRYELALSVWYSSPESVMAATTTVS